MIPELIIRLEQGQWVLRDRLTGTELARGTENEVRHAAHGVGRIVDAPMLQPVIFEYFLPSGYAAFVQQVAEDYIFLGRVMLQDDEWTSGVMFPDYLGISYTERLADVPLFVLGVQQLSRNMVVSVQGDASISLPGDPPLLGDWIRSGTFTPNRLLRRFAHVLGGQWTMTIQNKQTRNSVRKHYLIIDRIPGT